MMIRNSELVGIATRYDVRPGRCSNCGTGSAWSMPGRDAGDDPNSIGYECSRCGHVQFLTRHYVQVAAHVDETTRSAQTQVMDTLIAYRTARANIHDAVHTAHDLGFSQAEIARAAGLSRRGVQKILLKQEAAGDD